MRSFGFTVVSFVMVATAGFSQKAVVPHSSSGISQKDEQQIRQLESEYACQPHVGLRRSHHTRSQCPPRRWQRADQRP